MKVIKLILIIFLSTLLFSCKPEDKSGPSQQSHNIQMNFSTYSVARFTPLDLFIPTAHAAVSDLKFCFKRLRFKLNQTATINHAASSDNIDLAPGQISISSSGSSIVNVPVAAGTYHRVEFDLEKDCDGTSKDSVNLVNSNGTYSTQDRITIKFDGTFVVDGAKSVALGIQNILDKANSFDGFGGVTLKESLESVSGNL
jgi:hypothetical protein